MVWWSHQLIRWTESVHFSIRIQGAGKITIFLFKVFATFYVSLVWEKTGNCHVEDRVVWKVIRWATFLETSLSSFSTLQRCSWKRSASFLPFFSFVDFIYVVKVQLIHYVNHHWFNKPFRSWDLVWGHGFELTDCFKENLISSNFFENSNWSKPVNYPQKRLFV